MPANKLEQKFLEEYQQLNPQQKIAVDTIEGPVMVIAGPGTGKTQILASRIGKILLDTDAAPENILCLTYTDAGVIAMRKRLLQFIGPDAYKVNIATFHAFCNDIIQDNLHLFEKNTLDPISDLERIELLKKLIDQFPKNHSLKRYRGDVYYEVNNLQSLFSYMKREGWTAAFINEKIDAYLADLPNREEYIYKSKRAGKWEAGDLKQSLIDEQTLRMEKLRAAVGEFARFQQLMQTNNRYDFDDMINWVIKVFEENKNLLANYQERYQYILVDEYQDTSGTQNKLVSLLISYWQQPNVFVVGDDDQSIFRFQGANVENMLEFANEYKNDLLTVVLTHNYRSTQSILDTAKTIIDNNKERLVKKIEGLSKELLAANTALQTIAQEPLLIEYPMPKHEMVGIVKMVQQWMAEGIATENIGIIYKENKYGDELATYFQLLKIPVYRKRQLNLLEMPFAQKIILLLKYFAAELDTPYGGDEMLFEILHFDCFGIPPIEIAKLSVEVAEKRYNSKEGLYSIRRALAEKATLPDKDLFTPILHDGLKRAGIALEKLIAEVPNITLQQLFENLIRETGIISHIMQSDDKHWQLQMLSAMFDFIKEENGRNPQLNLQQAVTLFELMEKEKLRMPVQDISGTEKGINLMTAHGSKGLEFDKVIVAGVNASAWEKKKVNNKGYTFPDTMFSSTHADAEKVIEELRRLFYVALTRARKQLVISYSIRTNEAKDMEPSMFIAELQDKYPLPIITTALSNDTLDEFAALHFLKNAAPEIEKIEADFVHRQLEKFTLNVTALNNYLNCPLGFYFNSIIRIPSAKNEATEFGSAIHFAIEKLFRKMQEQEEKIFLPKENFITDFDWFMHRHRESFTREQFDRRLEYGREILSNYYKKYIDSFSKIVSVELTMRNVAVAGVPIKGKIDKLEFDGKLVNVVDYKSGKPENGIKKIKGPSDKNPTGGDYWRQAVFYHILVDNYETKNWKVQSVEFDFIEPDEKKQYRRERIAITPDDIAIVKTQIVDTWQKIQDKDFYTGCGKADCHWCNFVKSNGLAVALHQIEQEQE